MSSIAKSGFFVVPLSVSGSFVAVLDAIELARWSAMMTPTLSVPFRRARCGGSGSLEKEAIDLDR